MVIISFNSICAHVGRNPAAIGGWTLNPSQDAGRVKSQGGGAVKSLRVFSTNRRAQHDGNSPSNPSGLGRPKKKKLGRFGSEKNPAIASLSQSQALTLSARLTLLLDDFWRVRFIDQKKGR